MLILTWILEPIEGKNIWNCYKFFIAMFFDTAMSLYWPGCCPTEKMMLVSKESPCCLLIFHLLINCLTVLLLGPAMHAAESLNFSWIVLMFFLRVYLIIVDPLFYLCFERIVLSCIPSYGRCIEWCTELANFICQCFQDRGPHRNHRRIQGQEGHISDVTDSDQDDQDENQGNQAEPEAAADAQDLA